MLDGFAAALRTTQLSCLMLSDMFDMLENLAALGATILVRRHDASPQYRLEARVQFSDALASVAVRNSRTSAPAVQPPLCDFHPLVLA